MQSLDFVETLNFREGNDILYHLQGQLASGFKPRSHEGNDFLGAHGEYINRCFNPRSHEGNDNFAIFYYLLPIMSSLKSLIFQAFSNLLPHINRAKSDEQS